MNAKQIVVVVLAVIAIMSVTFLMPQYKIQYMDANNFIVTEQSSPLYARALGQIKRHWERILPISGGILLAAGVLCFVLRNKRR
jgi:hypothetical protein